jgi:tetratricopeptide (TPR) repeat protein
MNRKWTSILVLVAVALLAATGIGCEKLRARDHLNKGVAAFSSGAYPVAVEHFKTAVTLDPNYPVARAYLATAYMMQYIPGADSDENRRMREAANTEFLNVLRQEPKNSNAMLAIAQLHYNEKEFRQAREWYNKAVAAKPNEKTAYYMIGLIAFAESFRTRMTARAELGMKPEDPGPLPDKKVREQLKTTNLAAIEEGMQSLAKALAIDSNYADAMVYMNLLYRERADLADTAAGWKKDTATADEWLDKTMATKRKLAAAEPAGGGITADQ